MTAAPAPGSSAKAAGWSALASAALLASACALQERAPERAPDQQPRDSAAVEPALQPDALPAPSHYSGDAREPRRSAIPDRSIDIRADCSFRDETGYAGRMKLVVAASMVRSFEATVDVPQRGACRCALGDFRQTRHGAYAELAATGSGCKVRLWHQASRVTVAFERCEPMCSGGAFPYLWPILANARKGRCG